MFGFRWQLWFNDSWSYVESAVRDRPHAARPNGYAFLLDAFEPFHAYWPIVVVQHLLALAAAVMIYALLFRRGVRPWVAALATAPLLLDAYGIELEHMLLSDTLFLFLVVATLCVLLWPDDQGWKTYAAVGGLIAVATLTRPIALALIPITLVWLIFRWRGWRPLVALAACSALPLVGYALWFSSFYGPVALTSSDGVFLYSRVMKFADCSKFATPPEEAPLCDSRPFSDRPDSQFYIWGADSPLERIPGDRFSVRKNELAGSFARRAIMAQPGAYLSTAGSDLLRNFHWDRKVFPDEYTYSQYEFGTDTKPVPSWAAPNLLAYKGDLAATEIVKPYSTFMEWYQRYFYLRGTMVLVILLLPLYGLYRRRWDVLLPWAAAWALLVVPAVTAEFDYRYVIPAVPLAALAAALGAAES